MGIVHGNLTQGELVQVLGRLVVKIGEKMHSGEFEDGVQIGEIADLVKGLAEDAYKEYTDVD